MNDPEVLGTIILHSKNSYRYVRRYLRGQHPNKGVLYLSHTGWETIVDTDSIVPIKIYNVVEEK